MNQLLCLIMLVLLLAGLFRLVGVNLLKLKIVRKLGLAILALFLVGGVLQYLSAIDPGSLLLWWLILIVPAYYIRRSLKPHKAPDEQTLRGAERTPLLPHQVDPARMNNEEHFTNRGQAFR